MLTSLILLHVVATSALPRDAVKDPLQPLAFLVGHCWAGEFPKDGGKDTHCFEAMYEGKFVRDKHVVRSKKPDYLGETVYGFDAKQQRIVFWYWSNAGVMDTGSAEAAPDGLIFAGRHLTEPKDMTLRTRWKRTGADRYEALNERKGEDGSWQTVWKIEYVRVDK